MTREHGLDVDHSEQGHRAIRGRWRAAQCFRAFHAAERAIEGIEALHMMRKGQVKRLDGRDSAGQAKFVEGLFGVAARVNVPKNSLLTLRLFQQRNL